MEFNINVSMAITTNISLELELTMPIYYPWADTYQIDAISSS